MAEPSKPGIAMPAVVGQLAGLWKKQPKGRKILAVAVVVGIVGIILATTMFSKPEQWTELAGGSSPEDSRELLARLQGDGIPARMTNGALEVPADKADEARAIAASAGLPHSGKGFELFDGSSLGESSFTEQVKYRRALEGELARSITTLAQVDSARVHLALGKRSVFKEREEAPSASVALHLHPGQQLSNEQVAGVRKLVAGSVEGMKPDAVVVVDNHGNLLEAGDPSAADRKAAIERTVTNRVRTMLERVVGAGKVSVVATADIDERKVEETEEIFDKDKQALRNESRVVEGPGVVSSGAGSAAAQSIGGLANATGNLPGTPGVGGGSGGAPQKLSEQKNYEVSRTVRQTVKPDAQLAKLHLAVVVDYKAPNQPRSEAELAELSALAAQAAGIDPARGDKLEMRSIAFAPDPDAIAAAKPAAGDGNGDSFELPLPLPILAGAAGGFLVLVTLVMLVLRKRRRNKQQLAIATRLAVPVSAQDLERMIEAQQVDSTGAIPLPASSTPDPLALPPGKTVRERVADAVKADVERTASVLSAWLQEAAPRGAK